MITRKPSKITNSFVNASHEEHLNVSKGIRTDVPITALESVVKSINFETSNDGAYILRKPLVKKENYLASLTPTTGHTGDTRTTYYLHDGSKIFYDQIRDEKYLVFPELTTPTSKVIIRFYDNDLKLHEFTESLSTMLDPDATEITLDVSWLISLNSPTQLPETTLFSTEIDHWKFIRYYTDEDELIVKRIPGPVGHSVHYPWFLANVYDQRVLPLQPYKQFTYAELKRFIKIYKDPTEENTYVLEIVHPESNSITTGLDVGNPETLDVNLLQDNPYAIRDLYGYGYVSTTKIVPYVIINEEDYTDEDNFLDTTPLKNYPVWMLTEFDFNNIEIELGNSYSPIFRMLGSTNPKTFNKQVLILKAFLTTAVTNVDLYCCWEESSNGGIDWTVCEDFIQAFEDVLVTKEVSDLTSKEFTETLYKESLKEAQSYIVEKKVFPLSRLKAVDFNQQDLMLNRPDVLFINNPDLSKQYRFSIYIDSNRQTPKTEETELTAIKTNFILTSGNIDTDGDVKYEILTSTEATTHASITNDQCILLPEGDFTFPISATPAPKYPQVGLGDVLHIYTENDLCKIKSIVLTLAPSSTDTVATPPVDYDLGSFIGTSFEQPEFDLTLPSYYATGYTDTGYIDVFDTSYKITYNKANRSILTLESDFSKAFTNSWLSSNQSKTILAKDFNDASGIYVGNISNTLYKFDYGVNFEEFCKPDTYTFIYCGQDYQHSNSTWRREYPKVIVSWDDNSTEITLDKWTKSENADGTKDYYFDVLRIYRQENGRYDLALYNYHLYCSKDNKPLSISYVQNSSASLPATADEITISVDYIPVSTMVHPTKVYAPYITKYTEFLEASEVDFHNVNYLEFNRISYTSDSATYSVNTFDDTYNLLIDDTTAYTEAYDSDALFTFLQNKNINAESLAQIRCKIKAITVAYSLDSSEKFTSMYLTSQTGAFQVPYSDTTVLTEDLTKYRNSLFASYEHNTFYDTNQNKILTYGDVYKNIIYISNSGSFIFKLMNSITMPEEVTRIISWRNYLVIFCPKSVYLTKYDLSTDSYNLKLLSNSVGVDRFDARTVAPVLNSIYFKSKNKIYKFVPNLYAASDDILNIHSISTPIDLLLDEIYETSKNMHNYNFSHSDADTYNVFIVLNNCTYYLNYNFTTAVWTLQKYSNKLLDIHKRSMSEIYVRDAYNYYYFLESLSNLLSLGIKEYKVQHSTATIDVKGINNAALYADYLSRTPYEIVDALVNNNVTHYVYETYALPIEFSIDFGQKSSNYTLDKQFLETKFLLATLSPKDTFPVNLTIYTDGVAKELHIDANTDGALWKTSIEDAGVLNTAFGVTDADYNGIFRQLIVKYSGKGKTIRHVISGESNTLFKFYSMNIRARILPKKH